MFSISQGYQGPRSELRIALDVPGATITDAGGIGLPRTRLLDWWLESEVPVTCMLHADRGITFGAGSQVASWADQVGAGNAVVEPGYEAALTVANNWSDGTQCVNFNNAAMRHDLFLNYLQGNADRTSLFLFRPQQVGASKGMQTYCSATQAFVDYQDGNDVGMDDYRTNVQDMFTSRDCLIAYVRRNGDGASRIFVNGREYVVPKNHNPVQSAPMNKSGIGCAYSPGGTLYFTQQMLLKQAAWIDSAIDLQQWKKIQTMILGHEFAQIFWVGNSITQGGIGRTWVPEAGEQLGLSRGKIDHRNCGVGGSTTPEHYAIYYDSLVKPYKRNACRNIIVFWEVSNDIDSNHPCTFASDIASSARVVVDNVWRYVKRARQDGFEVLVVTPILRSAPYYTANQSACCRMAAELMRNEWQQNGANGCISPDMIPVLMDPTNTYRFVDGIHPSKAGCDVIRALMVAAVEARIESGSS